MYYRKTVSIFCFVSLMAGAAAIVQEQQLPSAESVANDWLEALGGEMAITEIQTYTVKGESGPAATDAIGPFYKFTHQFRGDDKFRSSKTAAWTDGNVLAYERGYCGDVCWSVGQPGYEDCQGPNNAGHVEFMLQSNGHPRLALLLAGQASDATVLGQSTLDDGRDVWDVEFSNSAGSRVIRHFDIETGLLLMTTYEIKRVDINQVNTHRLEYGDHNGMPVVKKRIVHFSGELIYTSEFSEIIINEDLCESHLDVPDGLPTRQPASRK